jgi:hypothetical protein
MKIEFTEKKMIVENIHDLTIFDITEAQTYIEEQVELCLEEGECLKRNYSLTTFAEALKKHADGYSVRKDEKIRTDYWLSDNFFMDFDKSLMITKIPNLRTIILTANYIAENVDYDITSGVDEFALDWKERLTVSYSTLKEEIKQFQKEVYELILKTNKKSLESTLQEILTEIGNEIYDEYEIKNNLDFELLEEEDLVIEFIKGELSKTDLRDYIIRNHTTPREEKEI